MQIFAGLHYLENVCHMRANINTRLTEGRTYVQRWGFAYGLFVVCAILMSSATARKAYFQFTERKFDEFRAIAEIKFNSVKAGRGQSMEARRVCCQNSVTCYELEFGSTAPGH
jgi:hypothetical protein